MLDRPALSDHTILDTLHTAFGVQVADLRFLPIGADNNTAVYRAESDAGPAYFVKVRLGDFHSASLTIPHYLHAQGLHQIILPLVTQVGQLWLCHGDIHGWNLLIDDNDQLFIVDWDTLIMAPKERDLMFIGGGHGDSGYGAAAEEALFYAGYGQTPVNHVALAYYRFARVLEDIVLFGEQILNTVDGEDRQQALIYLQSNFLPESTLARAYEALDSGQWAVDSKSVWYTAAKRRRFSHGAGTHAYP